MGQELRLTKSTEGKRESRKVKLHLQNGVIHWDDGQDGGVKTIPATEMSNHDFVTKSDKLFVFGVASNALLLTKLFESSQETISPCAIYVAGPPGISVERLEKTPAGKLFRRMDSIEHGASGCGWHRMTKDDYVVYQLIEEMQTNCCDGRLTDHARSLLRRHPGWPVVEFVSGKSPDEWAAAKLFAKIVEPRWCFDEKNGVVSWRRIDKVLEIGGGDSVMLMTRFLASLKTTSLEHEPCCQPFTYLLRTWAGPPEKIVETIDLVEDVSLTPRMFLWQIAQRLPEKEEEKREIGIIRASGVFLRFLVSVWVDNMNPRWELFLSEDFFSVAPEVGIEWQHFYAEYKRRRAREM